MSLELPRPTPRAPHFLGATQATWKARAVAYTLCFVGLACALVGVRYATREEQPTLRALLEREAQLEDQNRSLALEAQQLTAPARVRAHALSSGMVPFSRVKNKGAFQVEPLPPLPPQNPQTRVDVETRWR